jgi:hypothetical protein
MKAARRALLTMRHPDEPAEGLASYASPVVRGDRGASFTFDIADAEAYEGLIENLIACVVGAIAEAGIDDALLTWPEG